MHPLLRDTEPSREVRHARPRRVMGSVVASSLLRVYPCASEQVQQTGLILLANPVKQQPAGLDMAPRRAILANLHRTSPIDRD